MIKFFKNKKVFVTGHTGFKGSWLVKILDYMGAKVKGYSLEQPDKDGLYYKAEIGKICDSVIGDVSDYEKLNKEIVSFEPDIVFHLAAQALVREAYQKPVLTYSTNVMGTVNLLQICKDIKSIRSIVNVTTDKVYQNNEWCYGYRETDVLNGYDPYSNSKSCSELVTSSYQKSYFNTKECSLSTARAGNVIGGGDISKDRIMVDCYYSAFNNNVIIIRNPFSIRPYQHVLECLGGYLLLAYKQFGHKEIEGAYNFGPDSRDCITTEQLVKLFCKYYKGGKYLIEQKKDLLHEANFLKLDNNKAINILGWKPCYGVEKAVEKTVAHYLIYDDKEAVKKNMYNQIDDFFHLEAYQ
jgi:CDP-glucose 4,6-dehydratase